MAKVTGVVGLLGLKLLTSDWKRILAAANWCGEEAEDFIRQTILDKLVEIEMAIQEEDDF